MTRGCLSFATVICILLAPATAAQQIPVDDTAQASRPAEPERPPPPPPRFVHDRFFLNYTAAFATYSYQLEGDYPGTIGMTGGSLANLIPGIQYRSAGAHHQPSELTWFGGDGQGVGFRTDRIRTGSELLGYPPSGAIDPITLPPFGDTLYVTAAPLLNSSPATVTTWRDPALLDSSHAVARHTNGPDGYAHTGGRFRSELGRGWEIDGTGFRTFSDGQRSGTAFDGHSLDVEVRRTFARYPARFRFVQSRGNRFELFRWQSDVRTAHLFYVLADLRFEVARPDSSGEWLMALALHHDDQKLDTGLVPQGDRWFSRTYTASLSRLWQGQVSGWLEASAAQQAFADDSGIPDHRRAELSGGVQRSTSALEATVTGAIATHTDYSFLWRAAVAATAHLDESTRLTLAAGRSVSAPDPLRSLLPPWGDTSSSTVVGIVDKFETVHETASLALNHRSSRLQLSMVAAAGRSSDLLVWNPAGDGASTTDVYGVYPRQRRFAGLAGYLSWHPIDILRLSGSVDQTITNEWASGGYPVFAPDMQWWAQVEFPMYVDKYNLHFTPLLSTKGAYRGTLPEDYGIINAGWDFRIKQLTIFWRNRNLLDRDYRTGGAYNGLDRHYTYGIRWEFWN